jgi:hypothetical protein
LAEARIPLPGAGDQLLRMDRLTAEGAALVCARRGPAALRFCRPLAPVDRDPQDEQGERLLYAFLTIENNDLRPIHAKAMPVLLTATDEYEAWLAAPVEEALALQRPLPNEQLTIVATGTRTDEGATVEAF